VKKKVVSPGHRDAWTNSGMPWRTVLSLTLVLLVTPYNSHTKNLYIRERLDRAIADEDWRAKFPNFKVINGEPRHSDHRPVIVVLENPPTEPRGGASPRPFRFEAGWIQEEQCAAIIENTWKLTTECRAGRVGDAVREVASELWDWSKNILGDVEKRIKRLKRDLENCRKEALTERNIAREQILSYKLEKLEDQRELYWRQRAHAHWLQKGD